MHASNIFNPFWLISKESLSFHWEIVLVLIGFVQFVWQVKTWWVKGPLMCLSIKATYNIVIHYLTHLLAPDNTTERLLYSRRGKITLLLFLYAIAAVIAVEVLAVQYDLAPEHFLKRYASFIYQVAESIVSLRMKIMSD